MKKLLATVFISAMVLCTGCSLFSDDTVVKFGDDYTHNDPEDLEYDDRKVLSGDGFEKTIEEYGSSAAYPDTMVYDELGNIMGMYDYDEETGFAYGWTNLEDGSYTAFEEGEEIELGKPDESKFVKLSGTVSVGGVVYGKEDEVLEAYIYLFLSDADDKEEVKNCMEKVYGMEMEEKEEKVLCFVEDADYIADEIKGFKENGFELESEDASGYAELLKFTFGLTEYTGESPYEPFTDYDDPDDIEFDEKKVLVCSGEWAVAEEYVEDICTMTDAVYGKDGKVVAHYTFYESPSEESSEKLIEYFESVEMKVERVSDTVLVEKKTGESLDSLITMYTGYNILKDDSFDDYVDMIKETYFSVICE